MSYDDIIEVLAAALLEKADTLGCLEVLDGFSQRPDTEIEVSAPISEEMLALPLHKQEWPEEWRTDSERKRCGHAGRTGGISEPLHSHGEEAEFPKMQRQLCSRHLSHFAMMLRI